MTKRWSLVLCVALAANPALAKSPALAKNSLQDARIGVLGLFHPKQLVISPMAGRTLECMSGEERLPVLASLPLQLAGPGIKIASQTALVAAVHCDNGQGSDTEFVVSVP